MGGWLDCFYTAAGIQIIVVLLAFTVFSFLTKLERCAEQLLAADPSYCWLYPSKQVVDRFVLFAYLDRVLFSHLERSVELVLTADLSACAVGTGRLLIARSMNNITGPTDARTEPGYKLNCTRHGRFIADI